VWEKWPVFGPAEGRRKRIPGAARSFFHRLARARSRAPQQGLVSLLGAKAREIVFRGGVAGRNRPAMEGGGGRALAAAAREASSLHKDELSQIGPETGFTPEG
jgi:hypothetical protein